MNGSRTENWSKSALPRPEFGHAPTTIESAFEDSKPYVLTELGKQFVHYTMNEVVTRIFGPDDATRTEE
jgi:DNA phosphorothioation-dependent restriction protein DptG